MDLSQRPTESMMGVGETQVMENARKKKPRKFCRCSFKKLLGCITFKPRLCYLKFIAALNIFQVVGWFIFFYFWFTLNEKMVKGPIFYLLQTYNPFIDLEKKPEQNNKIMKNLIILSVP